MSDFCHQLTSANSSGSHSIVEPSTGKQATESYLSGRLTVSRKRSFRDEFLMDDGVVHQYMLASIRTK